MTEENNWFGPSESDHLEVLKVASGSNITLNINKVEVSSAGLFRQMDYNIPSCEKWTIPAKDKLMVIETEDSVLGVFRLLVYQKSAMNNIGMLLGAPTKVRRGELRALPDADPNRPEHSAVAVWIPETPIGVIISRAEGRYGIYSASLDGGGA